VFERFRIKATLRVEVIGLRRAEVDPQALMTVEMIFHEAAYVVAPMMRLSRWSAQQAMVFMVTDVLREAEQVGNIEILRQDDPATHAALEQLYRRVLDLTATQPELAACVSVPADGETAPFTSGRYVP
jgi:hypothetical protein